MKNSELRRPPQGLKAGSLKRKTPPKRSQPKRCWDAAREKVEAEAVCRYYDSDLGCAGRLEAAHILGREHDFKDVRVLAMDGPVEWDRWHTTPWTVHPLRIVPLCKIHHDRYDGRAPHRIDLLGCLTPEEEAQAVLDAGSLETARVRTAPSQYRSTP